MAWPGTAMTRQSSSCLSSGEAGHSIYVLERGKAMARVQNVGVVRNYSSGAHTSHNDIAIVFLQDLVVLRSRCDSTIVRY